MPSITLNNPEDKATVKRFLSTPNARIITATVARLYVAYPDPYQWTYSGIIGATALIQTSSTFYLRIVDLLYGKGVVWEQELYEDFVYTQDKPFFHTFQAENYVAGFSFADDHEADVFFGKVNGRASLRPFKPVPTAGALAKSGKTAGAQGRGKIPLHNGKVDKSRIGLPSDFRHIGHIGWDPDAGFDAQNIDPAWRELFEQLDTCGVSRQQIKENASFITDFVNAHGGLTNTNTAVNGTTSTDGLKRSTSNGGSKPDLSRIDSPPQSPRQRPPPPPPPSQTSTTSSATTPLVSPAPFHGYLPRPLAQVMASLSFGYSAPQQQPSSSTPLGESTPSTVGAEVNPPVLAAAPPPPPPPPPNGMNASNVRGVRSPTGLPPLNSSDLRDSKTNLSNPSGGRNNSNKNNEQSSSFRTSNDGHEALLDSIRNTGGLQGLRKTGRLRSPPPMNPRASSPVGARGSQGDLVTALVAALQRRQTKVSYSDDEEQQSDDDDGWDADD